MKCILSIMVMILLACSSANTRSEKTFSIPTYTQGENTSPNIATHKPGDVEVFKIGSKEDIYLTRMYRKENGETRSYETTVSGNSFDQMNYEWMNDSTVSVKLIDTKNNKTQTIHLMGSGAVTTVQ